MRFFLKDTFFSDSWYEVSETFFRKVERSVGFLPTAAFSAGDWHGQTWEPGDYYTLPSDPHNPLADCYRLGPRGMCYC